MAKDKAKQQEQNDEALATIENLEQQLGEMTIDLQRNRADFENYRKRTDVEKENARVQGAAMAILKLLPVVDNIERAISHIPDDLQDNKWAQSVNGLTKQLDKSIDGLGLKRIEAKPGTLFDPELHEAIASEDGEADEAKIAEELQAGYELNGRVIRHSMVKVTHNDE